MGPHLDPKFCTVYFVQKPFLFALFSYASSSTLYPCEKSVKFQTSVALRLASLLKVCPTSNVIFDSITTLQIYTESALKSFYLGKLPLDDYKKLSVQMKPKLSAKFNCKRCQQLQCILCIFTLFTTNTNIYNYPNASFSYPVHCCSEQ